MSSTGIIPKIIVVMTAEVITVFNKSLRIVDLLLILWITGTIAMLHNLVKNHINLYIMTRFLPSTNDKTIIKIFEEIKKNNNIKQKVRLIVNEAVISPAEYGFYRQTILLPAFNYTEQELKYILLHELMHFANYSNWFKFAADILRCIFWWNPIIYLFEKHIDLINEIYVDLSVADKMEKDLKISYLKCILNVLQSSNTISSYKCDSVNPFASLSDDKALLKRFEAITMPKAKTNKLYKVTLITLAMIAYHLVSYKFVFQPGYMPQKCELIEPEFTPDNSYIMQVEGNYYLYYNDEPYVFVEDISLYNDLPLIKQ